MLLCACDGGTDKNDFARRHTMGNYCDDNHSRVRALRLLFVDFYISSVEYRKKIHVAENFRERVRSGFVGRYSVRNILTIHYPILSKN